MGCEYRPAALCPMDIWSRNWTKTVSNCARKGNGCICRLDCRSHLIEHVPTHHIIGNRLFEDHAGTYRASLIRQLSEERARLAAYLQQASSTEQKEQRRNTLWQCAALEYAQAVIDAVWNIYHHLPSLESSFVQSGLKHRAGGASSA